ncbi:hypothetical protein [Pseudonocardia sp. GCM10023141]|uniref:hypothetical protein n=1 Tax=Pseudonocardia sp. GCM10023141 TaxID=3252653 RepID=UPI00360AA7D3
MRTILQLLGLLLLVMGISGTVDRLVHQPVLGFLNAINRYVIPQVSVLTGREVFANLVVAALGAVLLIATGRVRTR